MPRVIKLLKESVWRNEGKYLYLIFYLVLIFFATPSNLTWYFKLSFWLFALFLVWIIGLRMEEGRADTDDNKISKISNWWLILPLVIIAVSRLIPFIRWGEAPLGYDSGIYNQDFTTQYAELQERGTVSWVYAISFISNLLHLFGWSTEQITSSFYIIINVFLGLAVYVVAKEFFNKRAALFAILIFALSVSQFEAYWYFYYRNLVGLILGLITFYLLKKKSYSAILVGGFAGAVHSLSFLPLGLAIVLYFIFGKNRKFTFISGLGILAIAFSVSWREFIGYSRFYLEKLGRITDYPEHLTHEYTGFFIDFDIYITLILLYLPLAILTLIKLIREKKPNYLLFYFLVNFIIVYFHFIFHNRYIILLDLVVIIFAGWLLSDFVSRLWSGSYEYLWSKRLARLAIVVLLVGALVNILNYSWRKEPLIYTDELNEIKFLSQTEEGAYVMATDAYYSSWIYGYSNRKTIAPGLFDYNKWNYEEWQTFWTTKDQTRRSELLDRYEKPLYIFIGDKQRPIDFSNDPGFVRRSKRIWQYIGWEKTINSNL